MPGDRVCIVGAGAAGLSAAHFLRARGYSDVTVLESARRVGGKCCSVRTGEAAVEVGALGATGSYRQVLALAREVGVGLAVPPGQYAHTQEDGLVTLGAAFRRHLSWRAKVALARYALVTLRHRALRRPGFRDLPAELAMPFADWARARGLEALEPLFELPVTGFGYGALGVTPAAYVLKYIHGANFVTLLRLATGRRASHRFEGGYQTLWERVAAPLDVRLGWACRAVRRGDRVEIDTTAGRVECDRLILAAPLDRSMSFLDLSAEEEDLFSKVRYNTYYVTLCRARGLPEASISRHPLPAEGGTCLLARGWRDPDVTVAYAFSSGEPVARDEIARNLREEVETMGGEVTTIEGHYAWRYFPHVDSETMAGGYFDRLEALQGQRRTYFTGGLLAFETVEDVVAYSKALVERFF